MNVSTLLNRLRTPGPWLLLLYVAGSSLLGLSLGSSSLETPTVSAFSGTAVVRDLWFWSLSIPADLAFVAASVAVAVLATRNSTPLPVTPLVSFGGSFVTYELSLRIVTGTILQAGSDPTFLIIAFGYPGLLFGGLAPIAWRFWRDRMRSAARAVPVADPLLRP